MSIIDICELSIDDAVDCLIKLKLGVTDTVIAKQILKEIIARLSFLQDVGLNYLSLSRCDHSQRW